MTLIETPSRRETRLELELKGKGKIIVSPLLVAQIQHLHEKCGQEEWSGILLFRPIQENLAEPDKFLAVAEAVYPMNHGSSGYTEYDYTPEELFDMYDRYPLADPQNGNYKWKMGHIHSHHSMATFFSGTDSQELKDNADKYQYYVSLIVNFNGKYTAKVAYIGETERAVKVKGFKSFRTTPQEVLVTFDLEVKYKLDDWFEDKVKEIVKPPRVHTHYPAWQGQNIGHHYPHIQRQIQEYNQKSKKDEREVKNTSEEKLDRPKLPLSKAVFIENRIKEKLPFLMFADQKQAEEAKLWNLIADLERLYPTVAQQEGHIGRIVGNFNKWLNDHFNDYLVEDMDLDYPISYRAADLITYFSSADSFALGMQNALYKKLDREYRIQKAVDAMENIETTKDSADVTNFANANKEGEKANGVRTSQEVWNDYIMNEGYAGD